MGDNGTLVGLSTFFDEIENKAKNTIHILLPKKIITLQALHQVYFEHSSLITPFIYFSVISTIQS